MPHQQATQPTTQQPSTTNNNLIIYSKHTIMPVMTDIVTNELLADRVERLFTTGRNYNSEARRQIVSRHKELRKFRLARHDSDTITYAEYLRITSDDDAIKDYCTIKNVPSLKAVFYRDFAIMTPVYGYMIKFFGQVKDPLSLYTYLHRGGDLSEN